MSESPIPDDPADPFDPAADVFDLDSGFDVVHAQKPPADYDPAAAAPRYVVTVTPPRAGALAEQIDRFMGLFLNADADAAPERLDQACYALGCPGGAAEAEALRAALAKALFDDETDSAVSVRPQDSPEPADAPETEPDLETPDVQSVEDDGDQDWLNAAAATAAHADGDTFDLDLPGPPPETETEAEPEPEPDFARELAKDDPAADVDAGSDPGPADDGPGEPDEANAFRADMRAIAEAARGEDDPAAPVADFQAALDGLVGELDSRLAATADRLEESAAYVDERAREALSALLSAGESLRGYARQTAGGDDGRLDRMEAGLHAALDRLAEAQTAQESRIAERVIAALGGGSDTDRAA